MKSLYSTKSKSQIYSMIKNLTPTLQRSQKIKSKILNRPSLALKNPAISLFLKTPPNSQRHQLFFNLLPQVTKTSLVVLGCTQLIPIRQWTKGWPIDSSTSKHIENLLANLKFLLFSISSIEIFPLVAAQAKKSHW